MTHPPDCFCPTCDYERTQEWDESLMALRRCTVEGCDRNRHARGFCSMHYKRWAAHGDPVRDWPKTITERFWEKISRTATCWLWVGSTDGNGYGQMRFRGRLWRAHRISWALLRGEIPDGLCVLHDCDTPPCVNPAHLFLGTQADNMADMAAKGRANRSVRARGEEHPSAKLSEADVLDIRMAHCTGEGPQSISERYPVTRVSVSAIVHGRTWKGDTMQIAGGACQVTALVTSPAGRNETEQPMRLAGVHIGGRRFILLRDNLGRLIQIEIDEAVEEQLRWALRKTRR